MTATLTPLVDASPSPFLTAEGAGDGLLSRLSRDHRASCACVELLIRQLTDVDPGVADVSLVSRLIDQIIDSPDDFHHLTERRLYRRLWYRVGFFLPRQFDLDEMHEERRSRRADVTRRRNKADSVFMKDADAREALLDLCHCVRSQVEFEENRFYPLLRRRLNAEDWAISEEETTAYGALSASLQRGARLAH